MTQRNLRTILLSIFLVLLGTAALPGQELDLQDRGLFFEPPREVVPATARFPDAHATDDFIVLIYQEIEREGPESGSIYVSLQISETGREWEPKQRVIGPIPLRSQTAPLVFASTVGPTGDIFVVVAESARTTRVYRSSDRGENFEEVVALGTEVTSVSPRLFVASDGGILLFVNQNIGLTQTILSAYSANGDEWSDFAPLVQDEDLAFNFLPDHVAYRGRDYVVFQSFNPNESTQYQLYSKVSNDGGRTWSEATLMTDFASDPDEPDYLEYDNQRPDIDAIAGTLAVVWERRRRGRRPDVFYGEMTRAGVFRTTPEQASLATDSANFPRLLRHKGETYVVWFTTPRGNANVALAARNRGLWLETTVSPQAGIASFARTVIAGDRLHVFWQYEPPGAPARISYLEPDQRARPPTASPANHVAGRRSGNEVAQYRWSAPEDPSGIRGYNYVWSRNPDASVPQELTYSSQTNQASFQATEDGSWYFRIAAVDRAGNWSAPETYEFFRDTTPPPPVTFNRPRTDEEGYLASNTFRLSWQPPETPDLAGYSISFDRVGSVDAEATPASFTTADLPQQVLTTSTALSQTNADNGLWRLTVAPVDEVGNIGEATSITVRLNKYIPTTQVFRIASDRDILGRYSLSVTGRGFTANGTIDRVILDGDGREPYDYVFAAGQDYRIASNREIQGLTVSDISTGSYRLGVSHTERGIYFPPQQLAFEESGVITFGDYTVRYAPAFRVRTPAFFVFQGSWLLVWSVVAVMAAIVVFSSFRLAGIVRDSRQLQQNAQALITGEMLSIEKKRKRLEEMKRTGVGLRVKFALFVVVLVVAVVVGVAVVLGNASLERQQATLGRGLEQRIEVLLRSVSSRAESAMLNPNENRLDLQLLTGQSQVMDEVLYVTFTGPNVNGSGTNYVWATNDPVINPDVEREMLQDEETIALSREVDTASYVPGESRLADPATEEVATLFEELNEEARTALGETPRNIQELNQQLTELVLQGAAEDDPELRNLDNTRRELELELNQTLNRIGNVIRSTPDLDVQQLSEDQTRFVFYTPIMAWNTSESPEIARYYRGTVRMGISTDLILQEIQTAQRELLISTGIVAAVAVAVGVIGALILATIVVIPINRLVRGVERIRDTEDKEELEGHAITLRTRDELSVLADTVNSMTQGLVKAAATTKELTVGKEVQKMFIPLEEDDTGRKMTTLHHTADGVELAGYYEGASAVSGDYFRYDKLDDRHYAVIKCDISGHGVAAALIMVQVATLYTSFFREWNGARNGQSLTDLVVQVNDIVESMSFKGRFAAFTLILLDTVTGDMRVCNAGDNLIDVLDGRTGRIEQNKLPSPPAAGVFPSDLVEMRGGFPEVRLKLKSGDTALLYTDGIEESMHILRDSRYNVHAVTEEDHADGIVPSEESEDPRTPNKIDVGQEREEFGTYRIYAVIEAIQGQREYHLTRLYDPDGLDLVFDFRSCPATPENVVFGLIAVEKVFRLYRHPDAGREDRVRVDTKIDDFLRHYFRQYAQYFNHPMDIEDLPEYRYFSHIREDEQEDDLTIFAIRKQ